MITSALAPVGEITTQKPLDIESDSLTSPDSLKNSEIKLFTRKAKPTEITAIVKFDESPSSETPPSVDSAKTTKNKVSNNTETTSSRTQDQEPARPTGFSPQQLSFINQALSNDAQTVAGALQILDIPANGVNSVKDFASRAKVARRKLALEFHPDTTAGFSENEKSLATQVAQSINVSYDTLTKIGFDPAVAKQAVAKAHENVRSQKKSTSSSSSSNQRQANTTAENQSPPRSTRKGTRDTNHDSPYNNSSRQTSYARDTSFSSQFEAFYERLRRQVDLGERISNVATDILSRNYVDRNGNLDPERKINALKHFAENCRIVYGSEGLRDPHLSTTVKDSISNDPKLKYQVYLTIAELKLNDPDKVKSFIDTLDKSGLFNDRTLNSFKQFAEKGVPASNSDILIANVAQNTADYRQLISTINAVKVDGYVDLSELNKLSAIAGNIVGKALNDPVSPASPENIEEFVTFIAKATGIRSPELKRELVTGIFKEEALKLAESYDNSSRFILAKNYAALEKSFALTLDKLGISATPETLTSNLITDTYIDPIKAEQIRRIAHEASR
jgi:hypothetical protein